MRAGQADLGGEGECVCTCTYTQCHVCGTDNCSLFFTLHVGHLCMVHMCVCVGGRGLHV